MYLSATMLSNVVDKDHFEEREKSCLAVARKYNKSELEAISEMFALFVMGMDENPDQDFLGELFMNLDLGNQYKGNVWYTPFYFRDVWQWRRVWAQMGMLFPTQATDTAEFPNAEPEPVPLPEPVVYNASKTGQLTFF